MNFTNIYFTTVWKKILKLQNIWVFFGPIKVGDS